MEATIERYYYEMFKKPPERLTEEYRDLCLSLGRDKEAEDVPESKDELVSKIRELNFEWFHKFHIS